MKTQESISTNINYQAGTKRLYKPFFQSFKNGAIKIRCHADGNVKNFLAFQGIENRTHINKESQRGYMHLKCKSSDIMNTHV
jgi:hypothetical protein